MKANFTYQKVTPESSENGDFSEHGWIMPGHWEYPLQDDNGRHDDILEQAQKGNFDLNSLGEFINFAIELGINEIDENSFYSTSEDINFGTGEETSYGLHIEGVTQSSLKRIARLIRYE